MTPVDTDLNVPKHCLLNEFTFLFAFMSIWFLFQHKISGAMTRDGRDDNL